MRVVDVPGFIHGFCLLVVAAVLLAPSEILAGVSPLSSEVEVVGVTLNQPSGSPIVASDLDSQGSTVDPLAVVATAADGSSTIQSEATASWSSAIAGTMTMAFMRNQVNAIGNNTGTIFTRYTFHADEDGVIEISVTGESMNHSTGTVSGFGGLLSLDSQPAGSVGTGAPGQVATVSVPFEAGVRTFQIEFSAGGSSGGTGLQDGSGTFDWTIMEEASAVSTLTGPALALLVLLLVASIGGLAPATPPGLRS